GERPLWLASGRTGDRDPQAGAIGAPLPSSARQRGEREDVGAAGTGLRVDGAVDLSAPGRLSTAASSARAFRLRSPRTAGTFPPKLPESRAPRSACTSPDTVCVPGRPTTGAADSWAV